ncbi:MAG: hypothetical protein NT159_24585 [Proteobacteria bacterium]|nr:hypothetical protein [Pseudomonadota bacterium]
MTRIDIVALEQQARQMRAEEMRRLGGIFSESMGVYFRGLSRMLTSLAKLLNEALRRLVSSNPQGLRQH